MSLMNVFSQSHISNQLDEQVCTIGPAKGPSTHLSRQDSLLLTHRPSFQSSRQLSATSLISADFFTARVYFRLPVE